MATPVPQWWCLVAEGLINRDKHEIMLMLYDLNWANSNGTYISRLFFAKSRARKNFSFHAVKGYIAPPGKYEDIRFTPRRRYTLQQCLFWSWQKVPYSPGGWKVSYMELETGLLRLRQKKGAVLLEGIMHRNGLLPIIRQARRWCFYIEIRISSHCEIQHSAIINPVERIIIHLYTGIPL